MPIPFTNYVDITSGLVAQQVVGQRQLITRIFTTNALVPTNSYAEFTTLASVGAYFGTGSVEYARASFYFGFVSKTTTAPAKISFASWVQNNTAPMIYGDPLQTDTLAQLQAITSGNLTIVLGGVTGTITGLSLAGDASLTAVAATLQTAIRAAGSGVMFTGATVTYAPSSPFGAIFEFVAGGGGAVGDTGISVTPVSGSDIGAAIGWESPNAVISQGSQAMSLTATMIASSQASNNFGSFCFVPALTTAQIEELATWNNTNNVQYLFLAQVQASGAAAAAATSAGVISQAGTALTLAPISGQYPEMIPGMILAATDYTKTNASQNYMYQQFSTLTPSVSDSADQATYDALRVNYYGSTQVAGNTISFYQRGLLTGGSTAPISMTVFANEIWFKSYVASILLNAQLVLPEISANTSGRSTLLALIGSAIALALKNGTISVPSSLNATQIAAITSITGSQTAWQQVLTIGYWIDVNFSSFVNTSGATEWQANYTLIYAKNNVVNTIDGTHSLI